MTPFARIVKRLQEAIDHARGAQCRITSYYVVNKKLVTQEEFEQRFGPAFKKMDEAFAEMDKAFNDLPKE